jgi:AcrR family transcriptional regulator
MGIAERQKRERDQRINVILDAATDVIAERGIEGATMEDIASVAELGKSTIYNYFASKQLLLAALDLRGVKMEEEGFLKACKSGKNGLDRTLRINRFYFRYAMENRVRFMAKVQIGRLSPTVYDQLSDEELMKEYVRATKKVHQILADAINDGINDGSIRSDLIPERMSLLLWSQSNGVIEIVQNRGEMIESALSITVEQIQDGFFRAMELQLAAPKTEEDAGTS